MYDLAEEKLERHLALLSMAHAPRAFENHGAKEPAGSDGKQRQGTACLLVALNAQTKGV